jgi:uncharacterized protein YjiS (DUF1127 family)
MTYYTGTDFNLAIQRPAIIARIAAALELRKQRRVLYSLTDTQLDDIGLTRKEVDTEYAKPFWSGIA